MNTDEINSDGMPLYRDGKPCEHPGCLEQLTHPCEGCGRIGGMWHWPDGMLCNESLCRFFAGSEDLTEAVCSLFDAPLKFLVGTGFWRTKRCFELFASYKPFDAPAGTDKGILSAMHAKGATVNKSQPVEFDRCFACEILLVKKSGESHHFPVPAAVGGSATVKLCKPCHDMVDRIGFKNWPPEFVAKGWASMTRESRLFVMKAIAISSGKISELNKDTERSEP